MGVQLAFFVVTNILKGKMAIVLIIGREVIQTICEYGPQSGTPDTEKVCFYDEMESE